MDVTYLYTNIPHNKGINTATLACEENDSISTLTRVSTKFLSLVLKQLHINYYNILQMKGCLMGSKCSCSYANLFMGKFEKDHVYPPYAFATFDWSVTFSYGPDQRKN